MDTVIFKTYDIQVICKEDFDESDVCDVGRSLVGALKINTITVRRDAHISGPALQSELVHKKA